MSKNYFNQKITKILILTIICLFLIFLNPKEIFSPARELLSIVAYPFQKTFYVAGKEISGFLKTLTSISELKNENEKLLRENTQLHSQLSNLKDQARENEYLREQLKLAPKEKFDLEAAYVIGQSSQGQGSWMVIDKGQSSGIQEGMPVIVSEGILVGKIAEVSSFSSRVILLNDSGSSVNAIDIESGARGILVGEYNLGLTLGMISQTDVLNVGDSVATSGLGGIFPKGLLIGEIQGVKNTYDNLFQQAVVVPKVRYFDLETVFILKK